MISNNISIINEKKCVGCSCCIDTCPVNIIIPVKDRYGFTHPYISSMESCINCRKCLNVCSAYDENYTNKNANKSQNGYVAININENERVSSSSGGIFPLLARYIFDKNGVVYGAAFNENFDVIHIRSESINDLHRMKGSKYVQSEMVGIYKAIEKDLHENKKVLFSGLPCQCYALKRYICLKEEKVNLFTCDLICHGIVSPKIWKEYLQWRSNGREIEKIDFRDKRYGCNYYALSIRFKDKSEICEKDIKDPYIDIFQNDYAIRECCTQCKFKNKNRYSDITIGDYAGSMIGLDKRIDDKKGKSLIITNTQSGNELFKAINKELIFSKINIDLYVQPNLGESKEIKMNDLFWEKYFSNGFDYIIKKYTEENKFIHLKRQTKRFLKQIYMKVLK